MSTSASPITTDRTSKARIRWIYASLLLVMLLASLDQTIVSTALPTIVGELNGLEHMSWSVTAYTLAMTVAMPVYGKIGDLLGRRNLFLIAIGLFIAGSALSGFAQGMTEFILFRALQGLGGAGLMILPQTIIADIIPAKDRAKYLAPIGAVFGASSVIGPLLGGWLTDAVDWRWTFWINLPLGAVAFVVAALTLKLPQRKVTASIDYVGFALLAALLTGIVLIASWGGTQYAWTSGTIIGLAAATIALLIAFVAVELRVPEPVIPMHLFRNRTFLLAGLLSFIIGAGMLAAISYLPTYLQIVYGVNATESGLLLISMVVGLIITSTLSGSLVSRLGSYRVFPIAGTLLSAIGVALLATLTVSTSLVLVCLYIGIFGAGLGLFMQILVLAVQNAVSPREVGTATSSVSLFRELGVTMGVALLGTVFTSRLTDRLSVLFDGASQQVSSLTPAVVRALPAEVADGVVNAYASSLIPMFWWLVPLFLIGTVLSMLLPDVPLAATTEATEDQKELSSVGH